MFLISIILNGIALFLTVVSPYTYKSKTSDSDFSVESIIH